MSTAIDGGLVAAWEPRHGRMTRALARRSADWFAAIERKLRDRVLASAIARLRSDAPASRSVIERLRYGFGNRRWAASTQVLLELARRADLAREGILECGSGASTLLIAARTAGRALPVVALEQSVRWHAKV